MLVLITVSSIKYTQNTTPALVLELTQLCISIPHTCRFYSSDGNHRRAFPVCTPTTYPVTLSIANRRNVTISMLVVLSNPPTPRRGERICAAGAVWIPNIISVVYEAYSCRWRLTLPPKGLSQQLLLQLPHNSPNNALYVYKNG